MVIGASSSAPGTRPQLYRAEARVAPLLVDVHRVLGTVLSCLPFLVPRTSYRGTIEVASHFIMFRRTVGILPLHCFRPVHLLTTVSPNMRWTTVTTYHKTPTANRAQPERVCPVQCPNAYSLHVHVLGCHLPPENGTYAILFT